MKCNKTQVIFTLHLFALVPLVLVQPVKEVHQFTAERMSELAGLGWVACWRVCTSWPCKTFLGLGSSSSATRPTLLHLVPPSQVRQPSTGWH